MNRAGEAQPHITWYHREHRWLRAAVWVLSFPAIARQRAEWISGMVIKIDRHGGAYDYSVFDGRRGFVGRAARKLDIQVGEDVKFATQGKLLLIVDRAGMTHRTQFRLQRLSPLPAPIARQDK